MFRTAAALLAAACLSVGCVSDIAAPVQTVWEADLIPGPAHPQASGSAAAVSGANRTEASIALAGVPLGTYHWRIVEGRCADPAGTLGADGSYPPLVVAEPEGASLETSVGAPMQTGRRYLAEVLVADTGEPVACGDFSQR
jgi:hypothetical protein